MNISTNVYKMQICMHSKLKHLESPINLLGGSVRIWTKSSFNPSKLDVVLINYLHVFKRELGAIMANTLFCIYHCH